MIDPLVHGIQRRADVRIGESVQPSSPVALTVGEMCPQRLNQQKVCQMANRYFRTWRGPADFRRKQLQCLLEWKRLRLAPSNQD